MRNQLKSPALRIGAVVFLVAILFGLQRTREPGVVVSAESNSSDISREIASLNDISAPEAFEFHRKIQARLTSQKSAQPKNFADIAYDGKFFVEWKKSASRVARFSFVLSSGQRSAGVVEATLDSENHLLSLRASPTTTEFDEDTISVLKDLVSIYAFRSDEDTTGKYEVKWTKGALAANHAETLIKTKVKYLAPQLASIQILRSEHQVQFDADQKTPVYFKGVEETSMKSSKEPVLFSHSEYELKKVKFLTADLKVNSALKLSEKLKDATLQLSQSANPYTHIAWEAVRPLLDSVSSLPASQRLSVFHSLVHALKTNPEKLAELADFIRQNLNDSVKANLGIGAMATVGTPESQKALTDLFQELAQSGAHPELQHSILGAFTTTDAVITPDARAFLNSLVNTTAANPNAAAISEDAAFALGSAIQKDSDPVAEQKLSDYFAAATTPGQKLAGLDAIGNSGDANFIPLLEQNLNASDADIREKAVFAARYIQDSRVATIFDQAMNDSNVQVSIAAVQAIAYQNDPKNYTPLLQKCSTSANSQLSQLCSKTLSSLN